MLRYIELAAIIFAALVVLCFISVAVCTILEEKQRIREYRNAHGYHIDAAEEWLCRHRS